MENYQQKYIDLMHTFFELVASGEVKVRIMFCQNLHKPNLTPDQQGNSYFLLYYQLIKHQLGLPHIEGTDPVYLRLNFDAFPHTREKAANFKGFIAGLSQNPSFRSRGITIDLQDIAEIDS